jgi:cell division protein FtsB
VLAHRRQREGREGFWGGGGRRRLFLLVGALLLGLLLVSLSGEGSLIRLYRLSRQRSVLLEEIERLQAENARLRREVGALRQEETRIEEIARLRLGLVRPREVIYRFAPPATAPDGPADDPGGR